MPILSDVVKVLSCFFTSALGKEISLWGNIIGLKKHIRDSGKNIWGLWKNIGVKGIIKRFEGSREENPNPS